MEKSVWRTMGLIFLSKLRKEINQNQASIPESESGSVDEKGSHTFLDISSSFCKSLGIED